MKRDGVHHLFRPTDVRRYPFFYIELLYAVGTIVGVVIFFIKNNSLTVPVPPGTSAFWVTAASSLGILALFFAAVSVALVGLYGLFRGGFKWRRTHMFGQFLIRLYAVIGGLFINGWYPASWIPSLTLTLIAAVIYLRLSLEVQKDHAEY